MDKEIGGQPLWIWLVGAAVIVGGYLYLRSHGSSSSSGPTQPDTSSGQAPTSTSTFKETITDLQSAPKPKKKPKASSSG